MTDQSIRLLIADDHRIFRAGLRALLQAEPGLEVAGEAANGLEVLDMLEKQPADVVLMDIDMGEPNGIDTTRLVREKFAQTQVLVLSMHSDISYIVSTLEAGASGYILKNTGKEEMLAAISAVARGDSYYSKEVSAKLVKQLHERKKVANPLQTGTVAITAREAEVLRLIAEEYSNPEIAERLFISIRTVDTHRRNLIEKLGVKNTAGLVKFALRNGYVQPDE